MSGRLKIALNVMCWGAVWTVCTLGLTVDFISHSATYHHFWESTKIREAVVLGVGFFLLCFVSAIFAIVFAICDVKEGK